MEAYQQQERRQAGRIHECRTTTTYVNGYDEIPWWRMEALDAEFVAQRYRTEDVTKGGGYVEPGTTASGLRNGRGPWPSIDPRIAETELA